MSNHNRAGGLKKGKDSPRLGRVGVSPLGTGGHNIFSRVVDDGRIITLQIFLRPYHYRQFAGKLPKLYQAIVSLSFLP